MATISGSVTSGGSHFSFYLTYTVSQDIVNNESTVTAKMYLDTNDTSYHFSAASRYWIEIAGDKKEISKTVDVTPKWPNGHPIKIMEHSRTITHEPDGSHAKINVSGFLDAYGGGWGPGKCYAGLNPASESGTRIANVTLATIPRASYITSSANFSVGNNIAVSIYRYSTSFTHTISAYYKRPNGTWALFSNASNVGTSKTLTVEPADIAQMYADYGQKANVPTKLVCTTYKSGTMIGSATEVTGTVKLPALTSASWATGTPTSLRIGDSATLNLTRANTGYTHDVSIRINTCTKTYLTSSTAASVALNTATYLTDILDAMPAATADMSVTVTTKYGDSTLGSLEYYRQVNCNDRVPTFDNTQWTYTCDNDLLTSTNQHLILNVGVITANITAANKAIAATGATISKYEISDGIKSSTLIINEDGSASGSLAGPVTGHIRVTAIDSRNLRTDTYKDVPSDAYFVPYFTAAAISRTNQVGTISTLSFSGSFWAGKFGPDVTGTQNTINFDVYRKVTNMPDSTYVQVVNNQVLDITPGLNTFSYSAYVDGDLGANGYTSSMSFTIKIIIRDKLRTIERAIVLSRGIPTLHMQRNGVGINKLYSKGALDVGGDIYTNDVKLNGIPVGTSLEWNTMDAPVGFLLENGAAVSRTVYAELFAVIGTTYGSGDGSTTFNLPNSTGRVAATYSQAYYETWPIGYLGGSDTLDVPLPEHAHSFSANTSTKSLTGGVWQIAVQSSTSGIACNGIFSKRYQEGVVGYATLSRDAQSDLSYVDAFNIDASHNHSVSGTTGYAGYSGHSMSMFQPTIVKQKIIKY